MYYNVTCYNTSYPNQVLVRFVWYFYVVCLSDIATRHLISTKACRIALTKHEYNWHGAKKNTKSQMLSANCPILCKCCKHCSTCFNNITITLRKVLIPTKSSIQGLDCQAIRTMVRQEQPQFKTPFWDTLDVPWTCIILRVFWEYFESILRN